MVKTKRTKYVSSFMGGVENPLWGFTILFCCGIFRVIQRLRSRYFEVCFFEFCLSWKFDEVA